MDGLLTSWILVFEFVVSLPLSFVFAGPLFRKYVARRMLVTVFSLIQAAVIGITYMTTPDYRIQLVVLTSALSLSTVLGLLAAKFGWHLGRRSKRVFEKVAGFWIKLLNLLLNS